MSRLIDADAFAYCGLRSVKIPDSVTTIGDNAFYSCSSLTELIIGEGVKVTKAKSVFLNLLQLSQRNNAVTEQNVSYALSLCMEEKDTQGRADSEAAPSTEGRGQAHKPLDMPKA